MISYLKSKFEIFLEKHSLSFTTFSLILMILSWAFLCISLCIYVLFARIEHNSEIKHLREEYETSVNIESLETNNFNISYDINEFGYPNK